MVSIWYQSRIVPIPERYHIYFSGDGTDAVEYAAELDAKIERTDDLIDAIVYELDGLTNEETEIVEEAGATGDSGTV